MAVLTWRNVDLPNRSDSLQGLAIAGRLLDNASSGLSDALGNFGKFQTQQNNNVVEQNALQFQDPEQLKAALANGSILAGTDPSKVSASTLAGLQTRVGDLINQAANQQTTTKAAYEFGREQQGNQLADAAQPTINKLMVASASGDPKQIAAAQIEAAQDPNYMALRSGQLNGVLGDTQSLAGKQTQNDQAAFGLDVTKRNDADAQAGLANAQMIAAAGYDNQGALEQVNKLPTPGQRQAAMSFLQGKGYTFNQGPIDGTGAGGVSTGGVGGASGTIANPLADKVGVMAGGKQLPDNIKTVGDLVDNTKSLASGNNNSSATGLYQITGSTFADFAPKALGADWRSADVRNPVVQDKVAGAIWDTVKNDPAAMQGRWVSLTPDKAAALKGASWEQARGVIAQGENSVNPQTLQSSLQQNQVMDAQRVAGAQTRNQQNVTNLGLDPERWEKATNNSDTTAQVAGTLSASDGPLKGVPVNQLQKLLDDIVSESAQNGDTRNAAQAGEILVSSLKAGAQTFLGQQFDKLANIANSDRISTTGQLVNHDRISALIAATGAGDTAAQVGKTLENIQAQKNLVGAQTAYQNAASVMSNILARERVGGVVNPQTRARAQAELERSTGVLAMAQAAISTNPNLKPLGWQKNAQVRKDEAAKKDDDKAKAQKIIDDAANNNALFNVPLM